MFCDGPIPKMKKQTEQERLEGVTALFQMSARDLRHLIDTQMSEEQRDNAHRLLNSLEINFATVTEQFVNTPR